MKRWVPHLGHLHQAYEVENGIISYSWGGGVVYLDNFTVLPCIGDHRGDREYHNCDT